MVLISIRMMSLLKMACVSNSNIVVVEDGVRHRVVSLIRQGGEDFINLRNNELFVACLEKKLTTGRRIVLTSS